MRIVPAVEAELRRTIRDARAKDPLISVAHIKEALEKKFNKGFSYQYVAKLVDKVGREALMQADRTKIEQRLNFTRENYRMVRERLLKIIYWEPDTSENAPAIQRPPLNRDVVEACKNIVMMDLALLSAEVSAGMYRSEQEAAQKLHYAPMPEERRIIVIQQFITWGMLPKAQVEKIVPALSHGDTTVVAA